MDNEVMNVRVVETESDYTETVKLAMIAGVATVVAQQATVFVMNKLNERVQLRRAQRQEAQKLTVVDESNE